MVQYTSRVDDWAPMWSAPKQIIPPTILYPSSASSEQKPPVIIKTATPVHALKSSSAAAEPSRPLFTKDFKEWMNIDTNVMVFMAMIFIAILLFVCYRLNNKIYSLHVRLYALETRFVTIGSTVI